MSNLVRFAFPRTGAHCVNPQIWVHVVWTNPCVGIRNSLQSHAFYALTVQKQKQNVSRHEPDPTRKEHPPHVERQKLRNLIETT